MPVSYCYSKFAFKKQNIAMENKDHINKGLTGTGMFANNAASGNVMKNDIDELQELEVMGSSPIPPANAENVAHFVLHKADTRGLANHGWLVSKQSFSFADYYNP